MIRLFCSQSALSSCPSLLFHRRFDDATYDQGADGAEGGDALPRSVVELDLDQVLLGLRDR